MLNSKKRRSPAKAPNLALTIARMIDAIDLNEVWVVRRVSDRRGWRLRGARPKHARQQSLGRSAKSRASAAKIARFVGADDNGTGRVSFLGSKKLPRLEGYAECWGQTIALSLDDLTVGEAGAVLAMLVLMRKERRKR